MKKKKYNISVDELEHALELTDSEDIHEEQEMLEGVIRFGDETVVDIMTSRLDMVMLDIKSSFGDVMKCIAENIYSRVPVYSGTSDNIKGVLYIKDLIPYLEKGDNFRWQSLIRPAFFVPESKKIDDLLHDFQTGRIHIAIVVDEFGGTAGIVAMEDLVEQMKGDAERRVRVRLVLEAVVKAENITVSEEEIEAEYDKLASMYNMEKAEVKNALNAESLSYDMKLQRALDFVKESSK